MELYLKGWEPGFNKVRLSRLKRAGGLSLADAMRVTGEILEGRGVYALLPNLHDALTVMRDVRQLGISEVHIVDRESTNGHEAKAKIARSPGKLIGEIVHGRVELEDAD